MTDIPSWIEDRLDSNLNNKLNQRHVVETMIDADRPFFSINQLRARVDPNVGPGTVRNRLNELQEIDVVAVEQYSDTLSLYYIDYPESKWPLGPEAKRALVDGESDTKLYPSVTELVTFQDERALRRLLSGGGYHVILLFVGGALLAITRTNNAFSVKAPNPLFTAAFVLLLVMFVLALGQLMANTARGVLAR